jgi:carboxypeptidase Taq
VHRNYPVTDQQRIVREVATQIGFDFQRGRLDTTEHPFCSGVGPNDCRITTRWDAGLLSTALYGVLHEAGHGLYEQGLPTEWYGLPPGEAASLGIHESQSRLWENLVGRSPAFWDWCFPRAKAAFPLSLADASADSVQRSLMVVQPSLIRVEADEVTYNLHVMMRFDLERAVIHGDLDVADLPSSLRPEFLAILRGFEAVTPLPGETPIHATVRKMSGEDAERLAARVVELFGEVARSAAPTLALAKEPNDRRSERFGDESDNVIPLLYASEA